jgi:hypothetical protein
MLAIVYLILGLIPPLVVGPLAGLAYIYMLKREENRYQIPFWVILVVVNLLVMFWVINSSGTWLPISSSSACFFTPVMPILTVLVMRIAWRRFNTNGEIDADRKRLVTIGFVLIPALQFAIFVTLIIFAPGLCKAGLVVCQGS